MYNILKNILWPGPGLAWTIEPNLGSVSVSLFQIIDRSVNFYIQFLEFIWQVMIFLVFA